MRHDPVVAYGSGTPFVAKAVADPQGVELAPVKSLLGSVASIPISRTDRRKLS